MKWRWYNPVECDNTVERPFVATVGDLRGLEDWQLRDGTPITAWDGMSFVKAGSRKDDGDPDDVLQGYLGVPIYSGRLQHTLNRSGINDIQYLPLRVLRFDGAELPSYCVANITSRVAALDFEHATYTLQPADYFIESRRGNVAVLMKPVLTASALTGHHVIRLAEFTAAMFVSETFKDVFEDGGFTGYSFEEVEVL